MIEVDVTSTPDGKRLAYDPRLSLNTIIICLTIATMSWVLIDKIAASAATTATMQQSIRSNEQSVKDIIAQRFIDRQELLSELREIKQEIKQAASSTRK